MTVAAVVSRHVLWPAQADHRGLVWTRQCRARVPAGDGGDVHGLPTISGLVGDVDIWFLAEKVAQSIPDDGRRRFPS